MINKFLIIIICSLSCSLSYAIYTTQFTITPNNTIVLPGQESGSSHKVLPAITSTIEPEQIINFSLYPEPTKELIRDALALTKRNLTYQYGSSTPNNPGMDCSGAIYFLLNKLNISSAPRQSELMYKWVLQNGKLHPVTSPNFDSSEFAELQPGDLLFWSPKGVSTTNQIITHVMMYLGKTQKNIPIVFGSSNGRTYEGKKMRGVSVFDFQITQPGSATKLVGYGCIPGLTCKK